MPSGIPGIYLILIAVLESPGIVLVFLYTPENPLERNNHCKHLENSGLSSFELRPNQ
jgi:hypothetical protein